MKVEKQDWQSVHFRFAQCSRRLAGKSTLYTVSSCQVWALIPLPPCRCRRGPFHLEWQFGYLSGNVYLFIDFAAFRFVGFP